MSSVLFFSIFTNFLGSFAEIIDTSYPKKEVSIFLIQQFNRFFFIFFLSNNIPIIAVAAKSPLNAEKIMSI